MKSKFVTFKKKPKLKDPYMIAAWPGMGNVAIRAVEFLCDELKAVEFAQIKAEGFFHPHEAWIENSQIELPRLPIGRFYFWKNPKGKRDLIIFICDAQPTMEKGFEYAQHVVSVAKEMKVKKLVTFASMPMPIDHTQGSKVWVTVTNKKLMRELAGLDIKSMHSGQISGLNGLLLSVGKKMGIEGFCLLSEIPIYAIQIENPKASKAVLMAFSGLLGLTLDFTGLDERSKIVDEEIEKLIDYFKSGAASPGPISDEEIESIKRSLDSVTKLPKSAKDKIEELFKSAEKDLSRAPELKSELDRWHVYKEYEDRFLDLFKQGKKNNN